MRFKLNYWMVLFLLLLCPPLGGRLNAGGALSRRTDAVNLLAVKKASLLLKANVYFGDQDEETFPIVSRFYLLDESLIEILKLARFTPEFPDGEKRLVTEADYLIAAAQALTAENDVEGETVAYLINEQMKKHQRAAAVTDQDGHGTFTRLRSGEYYLFGIGSTGDEIFVWHLPVQIRAGGNTVEIDQTNAEVIFEINE